MNDIGRFQNVLLCEDIRDEVGRKKSLMGVFGGDVLVPSFPAQIQIAIYMQYQGDERETLDTVRLSLWQDETEIGAVEVSVQKTLVGLTTLAIPKSLILFEKACRFRVKAIINGGQEQEILAKKIALDGVVAA